MKVELAPSQCHSQVGKSGIAVITLLAVYNILDLDFRYMFLGFVYKVDFFTFLCQDMLNTPQKSQIQVNLITMLSSMIPPHRIKRPLYP